MLRPWAPPPGPNLHFKPTLIVHHPLQVVVRRATADVYAACIDSKVCVKVGYGNWSPGQDGVDIGQRDWVLAHSGPSAFQCCHMPSSYALPSICTPDHMQNTTTP